MAGPSTPVKSTIPNRYHNQEDVFDGVPGAPKGKQRSAVPAKSHNERQARIKSVARRLSFGQDDFTSSPAAITHEAGPSKATKGKRTPVKGPDDVFSLKSPIRLRNGKSYSPASSPYMKRCYSSSTSMEDLISKKARLSSGKGREGMAPSALIRCKTSSMARSLSAMTESTGGGKVGTGANCDDVYISRRCTPSPGLYDALQLHSLPLINSHPLG